MGWQVGFDSRWNRDIGYGVPAECDQPSCPAEIDRGLGYVCGNEPYGGEHGCGLFFCSDDLRYKPNPDDPDGSYIQMCERCLAGEPPFDPKPDLQVWLNWKLLDESWAQWRSENPAETERIKALAGG